jgi:3-hydroxyacyl-[acyl-carrier-protein] dehydratase
VVPGSLIVHAFLKALRRRDGSLRPVHMKKFRFRRFIAPGTYTYTLVRDSGRVQCTLYHQESVVVTGEFIV